MARITLEHIMRKSWQKYSSLLQRADKQKHIQKALKYAKAKTYSLTALLKRDYKKGLNKLDRIVRLDLLSFFKNPLPYLGRAKKVFLAALQKSDLYLQKMMRIPPNPFHLLLTLFVIIFVALSLLSDSNPFRLLFPAFSFPIPASDERKALTFYALSRRDASLVAMQGYLLKSDSLYLRLKLLASLLAEPLHSKIKAGQAYTDLEVLPLLGNSIRRVWQPYAGHIIIDMSKDAIADEMRLFNQASGNPKREGYYIDAFFRAFSVSIFQTEEELQSIEFWLDAQPGLLPSMNFNLRQKWTRASTIGSIKKEVKQAIK